MHLWSGWYRLMINILVLNFLQKDMVFLLQHCSARDFVLEYRRKFLTYGHALVIQTYNDTEVFLIDFNGTENIVVSTNEVPYLQQFIIAVLYIMLYTYIMYKVFFMSRESELQAFFDHDHDQTFLFSPKLHHIKLS